MGAHDADWINNFIVVRGMRGDCAARGPRWADFRLQGLITPPLVQNTGFGAYVFFAVFCFLSLAWTFCFVPETNGRSLEDMDAVFKDNSGVDEVERKNRHLADVAREHAERSAEASA